MEEIEKGHIVQTLKESYPISWGEVIYVSWDKKFYSVLKKYGTKVFCKHYKADDLKLLPKFEKFHLTSKK